MHSPPGNIRAKWPSVCRRGIDSAQRVVELFTGYKGPRYCVEVSLNKLSCDVAIAVPDIVTKAMRKTLRH